MRQSSDRVALVTNATQGLGYEVARRLAERGYQVLGSTVIDLDRVERLDLLVNNPAGIVPGDDPAAVFRANYLAPFALTRALASRLTESAGRVVTVASSLHRGATLDPDELSAGRRPAEAYAKTQLALILMTRAIAEHGRVTAVAVHPGLVGERGLPVRDGADNLMWAMDGAVVNGGYYEGLLPASPEGVNDDLAKRLWQSSAGVRPASTSRGYTGFMGFAIERDTDRAGKTTYLLLSGVFDRYAQRDLRRALRDAFARSRHGRVVLDVARVDDLSGECVETLLTGYTLALRGGYGFEVTNARGHIRLLLEATGLCAPALYAPAWLSESTADVA